MRLWYALLGIVVIIAMTWDARGDEWHEWQLDMARHAEPKASRWPAPDATPDARTHQVRRHGKTEIRISRKQWERLRDNDG